MMSNRTVLSLALALPIAASLGACGVTSATGPRASLGDGAAECPRALSLPARALAPERLLVLGDYHGTNEIPSFVGDVACALASGGGAVRIGLEIPKSEQGRIDAFLASDGEPASRDALLAGEFWSLRDGRSSTATFALLERIRRLAKRGVRLSVLAFDIASSEPHADRDDEMAKNVATDVAAHPGAAFVIQVGNLHARTTQGVPWDPEYRPMGLSLKAGGRDLLSLDFAAPPGKTWACTKPGECGINEIGGNHLSALRDAKSDAPIELFATPSAEGYDGIFRVSRTTAAPPMVAAGQGR